ncbi:hypothetical protein, partial [Bacillus anthracis]|uniref:hypothetical protein n=1 Tax=Bacillus anthracis TaxID=1392 RepID=UPI00192966B4
FSIDCIRFERIPISFVTKNCSFNSNIGTKISVFEYNRPKSHLAISCISIAASLFYK